MTFEAIRRLVPGVPASDALIDLRPGADHQRVLTRLGRALRVGQAVPGELPLTKPSDLVNFGRVERLPLALAAILGVLGLLTLAHLLATAVGRRRRDLAVLKTVGFERRQVVAVVAWQATTLVALALLIGLPLGVASGRWVWRLFADEFGIVPRTVIPLDQVLLVVPAAIVVANVMALLPARAAALTQPARVLRAE